MLDDTVDAPEASRHTAGQLPAKSPRREGTLYIPSIHSRIRQGGQYAGQCDPNSALKCGNSERQTSQAVRRILSPGRLAAAGETAIHLGPTLPLASCGLPADSGGQPSNVRAERLTALLLTLLQVGFA